MKAILWMILLLPAIAHADGIWCKSPKGWERSGAQTMEQARYEAQERWKRQLPCIKGDPNDSFDTDAVWNGRQHLRPFLPPDIRRIPPNSRARKGDVTEDFRCGADGNFAADGSSDLTRCYKLTSASMGYWKIRTTPGDHTWLWRLADQRLSGPAKFWAEVSPGGIDRMSPEAQAYAETRGFKVRGPVVAGSPTPAAAPAPDCSKLILVLRIKCEAAKLPKP